MKKLFGYILIAALTVGVLAMASCDEDAGANPGETVTIDDAGPGGGE